ncbi:MAG: hypothetical protein KF685_04045 [Acidobacteria bacterium]|nr:hypothetical protein [Acidobacteriota bacterium]
MDHQYPFEKFMIGLCRDASRSVLRPTVTLHNALFEAAPLTVYKEAQPL